MFVEEALAPRLLLYNCLHIEYSTSLPVQCSFFRKPGPLNAKSSNPILHFKMFMISFVRWNYMRKHLRNLKSLYKSEGSNVATVGIIIIVFTNTFFSEYTNHWGNALHIPWELEFSLCSLFSLHIKISCDMLFVSGWTGGDILSFRMPCSSSCIIFISMIFNLIFVTSALKGKIRQSWFWLCHHSNELSLVTDQLYFKRKWE